MANPLAGVADKNLRLAIIDKLTEMQLLPPFSTTGSDDRDYEYNDDIADALLDTGVTAEQCAAVRDLYWEAGSNDIIFAIWTHWDGESDEFHAQTFDGLAEALPNLESLAVDLCAVRDLAPLAEFTQLRDLSLDGGFGVTDLGPLAKVGTLRKLRLNHLLDPRLPDVLGPLAGLRIEELDLSTNSGGHRVPTILDFAPIEDMTALRTLRFRRTVRTGTPPVLEVFDNARVIDVLKARGVTVDIT